MQANRENDCIFSLERPRACLCVSQNLKWELEYEVFLICQGLLACYGVAALLNQYANWMQKHYIKEQSFWEAKVNPMDSYIWKDIAQMRSAAVMHMSQDDDGNWLRTTTTTGLFS